jgi:hypothetical protein
MYDKPAFVIFMEYAAMIGTVVIVWLVIIAVSYVMYQEIKEKRGRKK